MRAYTAAKRLAERLDGPCQFAVIDSAIAARRRILSTPAAVAA